MTPKRPRPVLAIAADLPLGRLLTSFRNKDRRAIPWIFSLFHALESQEDFDIHWITLSKAVSAAEKNRAAAGKIAGFAENEKKLSKMEIDLAKAEIFNASSLPALLDEKRKLLETRRALLVKIGLTEKDLAPKFSCEKCSDTGFLPGGKACDCYKNAGN